MKIPLCKIYTDEREVRAVKEVLDSGWLAHGPKNKEFEKLFFQVLLSQHLQMLLNLLDVLRFLQRLIRLQ